jgi:PiT family inorganic phosphate transporter
MLGILVVAAIAVAVSNGANDVFKGFATVWGSSTASYRRSLTLAILATVAGGCASIVLAGGLVRHFSGKGLVPDALLDSPTFASSIAVGAGATVLAATRLGFPVSTTHALVGALIGAGLAAEAAVNFDRLIAVFVTPLLISPIAAAALAAAASAALGARRRRARSPASLGAAACSSNESESTGATAALGAGRSGLLDRVHVLSAVAICFARAVNDAPKIASLLFAGGLFTGVASSLAATGAMALGGALFARRVAETMSLRICTIDASRGFAANIVTTSLVLSASVASLPVSTTHVAVGAISGAGARAAAINGRMLKEVLLSWLATLPCAGVVAFGVALVL